jgi:hypothetical protein
MELLGTGKRTEEPALQTNGAGGELEIRLIMPRDAAVGLNLQIETGASE